MRLITADSPFTSDPLSYLAGPWVDDREGSGQPIHARTRKLVSGSSWSKIKGVGGLQSHFQY